MRSLRHNLKKLVLALCISVIGIVGSALLVLTFTHMIQGMKVFVETPTNAPPFVLATADSTTNILIPKNNWIVDIPFNEATNKFISETDIEQIKKAIPWHKMILHLYLPKEIVVETPTEAYAEFSRQHIGLRVRLVKRDNLWQVEDIRSFEWELAGPPNLHERIAESLPR